MIPVAEQNAYYRDHAPHCLAAFLTSPHLDEPAVPVDGHGEETQAIFFVRCRCGSDEGYRVEGYEQRIEWQGQPMDIFVNPYTFECCACGATAAAFDSDLAGYDALAVGKSYVVRGEGQRVRSACKQCGADMYDVTVRFEFISELIVAIDGDGGAVLGEGLQDLSPEDLFSWISIIGHCRSCGTNAVLADVECS